MAKEKDLCKNCKFWGPSGEKAETPRGIEYTGRCFRHPPIYVINMGWGFPHVGESLYCGDHVRKRDQ